jgi:predicted dehydrogenase
LAAVHPAVPAFVAMLDAFVAALDGEATRPFATFADGLATQRVLEAVGYGAEAET